jgi:vacuolar-type H+-ATPase subunit I/STV1
MTAMRPLRIYEEVVRVTNNKELAHVIAEAFDELDNRYPGLGEVATKTILSETELRLIKEIESVRLEIKEVESKLAKEIESVRLEIKEVESKLAKEIESVRLEIKEVESKLAKEIKELELKLLDKINSQTTKTVAILSGYITFVAALFKFFS